MQGYFNKEKETAETLIDGWLHTGDLGRFDDESYLYITGRKKEIIVLPNGKNIDPVEIEQKLKSKSNLIDECGVFLKDDMLQVVIFPDFDRLKEREVLNIDEVFKWDVMDAYNRSVS